MVANASRVIQCAMVSVRSLAPALPRREEMEIELADAIAAEGRGYFLPDEDERMREIYVRYLMVRSALLETIDSLEPVNDSLTAAKGGEAWELRLRCFLAGFTAATMLVRSAAFIVDLAGERSVVRAKLDEPEPRFGIPAKTFTRIYKNLVSSRRMWRFYEALRFYELHKQDLEELASDSSCAELLHLLDAEAPFLRYRKRDYVKRKLEYRLHSFKRRHTSGYNKVMFHLLKISGSAIAEIKQPFVKPSGAPKRVTADVISAISELARPGDVFVTRHDDAMSNLFLPGFWPHAALYIGGKQQREKLSIKDEDLLSAGDGRDLTPFQFLEAKKDGVLLRPAAETLSVDAFMILRPRLTHDELAMALKRSLSHEGKLYDFVFDFRKADRLACTELVYRSYHGIGPVNFELHSHSGRLCISAEDLIDQALTTKCFEKVADFGVENDMIRIG